MNIKVLNKHNFNQLMIDNKITKENIGGFKNLFIVSINDTSGEYFESYFQNVIAHNVIVLHFDDTDENKKYKLLNGENIDVRKMTDKQGREIINFFKYIDSQINDNTQLIIHCTAGQNRSGSVGKFAIDYFKYNSNRFILDNPMVKGNSVVTRTLNKLYMWDHYE